MQQFTIRDIENLTGIKAHTLRIWEQRYQFFTPKRKESQHRIYDNEDLKKLLQIAFLYHNGWKISKIASLTSEEIQNIISETKPGSDNYQAYIHQLTVAALDFNEFAFINTLQSVTDEIGFEKCIVEVCYPYLVRIGHLWSSNNAIPAQEHFSSYIIQNRIIVETEKVSTAVPKAEIVLLCPRGEFHELPLLFLNYMFRKHGWGTIYMGTNIRKDEVEQIVTSNNVEYIYLHMITNFTGLDIDDFFADFCKRFPGTTILASGGGVQSAQRSFVNLHLLRSDAEILRFVQQRKIT